jgi:hypothetical protein
MDDLYMLHPDHTFLRREAVEHGYRDQDLHDAVAAGHLVRMRQGAYTFGAVWANADPVERHVLRADAVLRSHHSRVALSFTSAAAAHGLRLHQPDLSKVHVTCLEKRVGQTTHDVVYHYNPCQEKELSFAPGGQLSVRPVRAGVEAASLTSVANGLVILDSVVNLGHGSPEEVHQQFERFHGPGSRRLRITVRLVRPGAESVAESLTRHLFWSQHVPEPILQFEVRDSGGNLLGRTDFAWPAYGLLGEFDGRVKYERHLRPGESVADALIREKKREDRLREITGWLMVRLVWADLLRPEETARRVIDQLERARRLQAA